MLHFINSYGIQSLRTSSDAAYAKYYSKKYAKTGKLCSGLFSRVKEFNTKYVSYYDLAAFTSRGVNVDEIVDDEDYLLEVKDRFVSLRGEFPVLFEDTIRVCYECDEIASHILDSDDVKEHMLPCQCGASREYLVGRIAFIERLKADLDPVEISGFFKYSHRRPIPTSECARDAHTNDHPFTFRPLSCDVCIKKANMEEHRNTINRQVLIDAAVRCGYIPKFTGPDIGDDIETLCGCECDKTPFNKANVCFCEKKIEDHKRCRILREISRIHNIVMTSQISLAAYDKVCAVLDDIRAATAAKVAALAYARDRDVFSLALTLGAKLDPAAARDIAREFYP
jgi:hypothetical protein